MNQETVALFIRQARVMLSHLQLYPPGSAMVQESARQLMTLLEELWKETPEVLFAESDRQLLVNGNRWLWKGPDVVAAEAFVTRLQTHHVKSVGLKRGLTADELGGFLELLGRKPGTGAETLGEQINAKGMTNVILNEKVYVVAGEEAPPKESPPPQAPGKPGAPGVTVTVEQAEKIQEILSSQPSRPQSSVEKAKHLLSQDPNEMLTDDTVKALPEMLKNLDTLQEPQLAGEMVDKFAANLESPNANVRLKTAQSFKTVTPAVEQLSDKQVIERLEERFIEAGERETAKPVYTELADLLERGADRVLGEGNYGKTLRIVGMFRRHTSMKDAGFIERWLCAQRALDRIGNRHAIEILVSDLRAEEATRRDQAYTVIMKLADAALHELIAFVQETEDVHLRRVIAYAIKNIGEEAVNTFVNSISQTANPEDGKRMVEVLEGLGQEGIGGELVKIFPQCHPVVKTEILRVLTRMRTAEAETLIGQAVDDADRKVRLTAIELSGKLRAKSLVGKLLSFVSYQSRFSRADEDDEQQEGCCRALGSIGEPQAIPVLVEMATGAPFMKRLKSGPVRAAAVLALGEFTDEGGKRALEPLLSSKDPLVRQAAEQAKRRQATKIHKKGDRLAATVL